MSPIARCREIDAGILLENRLPIPRVRREPIKRHTAPVIGLVHTVKPRINNYRQTCVDVEQSHNLLRFSRRIDVQAWYSSLFYRVYHPFHNLRVDGFSDRKSTRLNSSHVAISYAVFCLKKKK